MQVVGSDKFKFFPVKIGNIVIPLGNIRYVKAKPQQNDTPMVEIGTYTDDTHYPAISLDAAHEAISKAFKDCEY